MKTFNPILREYTAPVDLSTLQGTYNTLEQGHKEAIKATSALKQAIAQYDLNEAENAWRQSKINEVQAIIQNNTIDGNSSAAVDDLMAASGDILFGADMMGRLKRQQAWKENNAKIDKMNITEDYKRIFKQLNPYGVYQDKIDENGNIYEGDAWKPTINPVNTVPLNDILSYALKWVAKEQGNTNAVRWLDANGNVTSDPTKSITGEIFSSTTGTWERVSEDKLSKAVKAAIDAIPGARESLQQDHMIAKWKYNHGEESDILGSDGKILSPTQYLNKRIDPFYDAATYYYDNSRTTYGDAWKAQLMATHAGVYRAPTGNGSGNGIGIGAGLSSAPDILQGLGNPITFENKMPIEAQAKINESKQTLGQLLKSVGFKGDVSTLADDKIRSYISQIKDPVQRFNGLQALSDLKVNTEYMSSIRKNISKDKDALAKFDAYTQLMSLKKFTPEDLKNPYIAQYNNVINSVYDDAVSIGQGFSDKDTFDQFVSNIGGKKRATELGIEFKTIDGKQYAILPKNSSSSLHVFTKAANDAFNQTHTYFGKMWNNFKNTIYGGWGDNVIRIDDNGNIDNMDITNDFLNQITDIGSRFEAPLYLAKGIKNVYDGNYSTGLLPANTAETRYFDVNNLVKDLEKSYDNTIENGGNLVVDNNVSAEPTPFMAKMSAMIQADPKNASHYKASYDKAEDQLYRTIGSIDMVQHGGYIINENGIQVKPTTKEAMEITKKIRSAKKEDITPVASQDPATGEWSLNLTIKQKDEDPIIVHIPKIDSATYEEWNRRTEFRSLNDVRTYSAANRPMEVVDETFNLPSVTLTPYGGGFIINNDTSKYIDNATAQYYRDLYLQHKDLQNAVLANRGQANNPIIQEAVDETLSNIAKGIALLYCEPGETVTEETINYIVEQLDNF